VDKDTKINPSAALFVGVGIDPGEVVCLVLSLPDPNSVQTPGFQKLPIFQKIRIYEKLILHGCSSDDFW
jgi:hypothetical protein